MNTEPLSVEEKKVLKGALEYMWEDTPTASANVEMEIEDYERVLEELAKRFEL